jgi:hypothetical protein
MLSPLSPDRTQKKNCSQPYQQNGKKNMRTWDHFLENVVSLAGECPLAPVRGVRQGVRAYGTDILYASCMHMEFA